MGRLRAGEWIAAGGGVALLAALFVRWYSGASAWSAFTVLDVVLALLALAPLALFVLQATRMSPSLPVTFSVFTTVAGALATLLIVYRIVNQPGPNEAVDVEFGAWLGLAAAAAITLGGWRSLRIEEMPGVGLPSIETLPAP